MTRGSAADEAAIREARRNHNAAYNKHDAKALAVQFATDGDRVAGTGEVFMGRARVEQGYADSFASVDKNAMVTDVAPMRIRFLTGDIALTDVVDEITGRATGDNRVNVAAIYVKREGQWLIAAQRNTRLTTATTSPGAK